MTSRCNLRCRYCHVFGSPGEVARELSTGEWLGVFEEFGAMKIMEVMLTGGEALLREDLSELIDGLCRNKMRFSLLSNGYAFEERHAVMLERSGRCSFVQISLDGPEAEHDAARGTGSFARAIEAIRVIRKHRLPLVVRMTVGKHNFQRLPETARLLIEREGVQRMACNTAFHFADKSDDGSDLPWLLTPREFLRVLPVAFEVAAKYPRNFSLDDTIFQKTAREWPYMIKAKREGLPARKAAPCASRCPAQNEKIYIRSDGAVTPCNHLPDTVLGWIGRDRIADLWKNAPQLQEMRGGARELTEEFPVCRGCEYASWCCASSRCLVPESGHASFVCLKRYQEIAPDFDFERIAWKKNAGLN